jgi:uncharacterized protein (TIGR02466 family)
MCLGEKAMTYTAGQPRDIFPVRIYEATFEGFDAIQDKITEAIMPYFENPAAGNEYVTGDGVDLIIRSCNDLHKDPELQVLAEFIEFHVREYWKACGFTKRVEPYILQMWANLLPPGGFTPSHNHNPVMIGGAFYIDATPEKGNLYLEHPLELVEGKMPRDYTHSPLLFTEQIKVEPGKLILFPGWLRHHTRSNMSPETRCVVGFNAGCWLDFLPKP